MAMKLNNGVHMNIMNLNIKFLGANPQVLGSGNLNVSTVYQHTNTGHIYLKLPSACDDHLGTV